MRICRCADRDPLAFHSLDDLDGLVIRCEQHLQRKLRERYIAWTCEGCQGVKKRDNTEARGDSNGSSQTLRPLEALMTVRSRGKWIRHDLGEQSLDTDIGPYLQLAAKKLERVLQPFGVVEDAWPHPLGVQHEAHRVDRRFPELIR